MKKINNILTSDGFYRQSEILLEIENKDIINRIFKHDYTVWKSEPDEITNRLGWLDSPLKMQKEIMQIEEVVSQVKNDGLKQALLLGMGGSSLAPAVFSEIFTVKSGFLELSVLDSTVPEAVLAKARTIDLAHSLFIVSTKSGGTVETLSFFKYFYNRMVSIVGAEKAGKHFIAITDPGSKLVALAEKYSFRHVFLNDPNIGGRYSALSFFGLIPAALIGINIKLILESAKEELFACKNFQASEQSNFNGIWLGALIGQMATAGRDKLTLLISPKISAFGAWVEQLIAESTGKEGVGILPVTTETPSLPVSYSDDRLFVYLKLKNDESYNEILNDLKQAEQPIATLSLDDEYGIGGEYFRWEMATIIASWKLKINPFDQPNVEAAKVLAREMVSHYKEKGEQPKLENPITTQGLNIYSENNAKTFTEVLDKFFGKINRNSFPQSYISLQAFIKPEKENTEALENLGNMLRDKTKLATTFGYGPRFLHSTGQLHKGDAGNGLFIQFTSSITEDAAIPDEANQSSSSMTFGILRAAQVMGDRQALLNNARPVITVDLGANCQEGLKQFSQLILTYLSETH